MHIEISIGTYQKLTSLKKSSFSIVICLLEAEIVEEEKTAVARQWLGKHIFLAADMHMQ
jgi:hypothetical protein